MPDHTDGQQQPREHRAGAWVLLVVGLAALGLGLYQWHDSIVKAFDTGPSQFKSQEEIEQERLDELKTKDTDGDGISDFDESYVFETSPYLNDSDSDGISDKEELESGTDPNCPEGEDCGPLKGEGTAPPPEPTAEAPDEDLGEAQREALESMLDPSPEEIRQLLLESGVPQEELDKIDDETLKELYQRSLRDVQAEQQNNP